MRIKYLWTLLVGVFTFTTAHANVVITGTRVVYPADKKVVSVELENKQARPALVQAWIEKDNSAVTQNITSVPFSINPPMTRVEANSRHTLRIRYTGEKLAQDRETLFYFNLLDIPPKPKAEEKADSYMQLTVRSRLKLFFRPHNLPYTVHDAYTKTVWQLDGRLLRVQNPTPYYITYEDVVVKQGNKVISDIIKNGMVAPFSDLTFTLRHAVSRGDSVEWSVINDFGGSTKGVTPLVR